ncbi:H-type lectin domain-containing protein [Paracoccus sp. TK19116]|uniref:H-type lectin domain-containing protein n=1 Tax=Paracoccus albicereus TaxID=2922394 RepID=A0ABT1MRE5_9RHOB|nr:H-type lectin domain-containing protein [Paracoccus albicereus]MCQ0970781.1 H-type lectin domain-containing protein [Paracoccus albicereus]
MRFTSGTVGVARGTAMLFSACEDGGEMWTGDGQRVVRQAVTFDEPFQNPPVVHVAMSMWDFASASNQRADIIADRVTGSGFEIVFRTWGDTRIARARAEWLAIGPIANEDDFRL